jgi:cobalamin-dependent methionine synthase I
MVKALADHFAEALNICTNKFVKKFGVMLRGTIDTEAMIEEIYKNSSAPGYPACPDHLENLFGNY